MLLLLKKKTPGRRRQAGANQAWSPPKCQRGL